MITYKIAVWNANGLSSHMLEVKQFMKDHDIDIMLISETHFTVKSFVNINGYAIHSTMHPAGTARGGSAVIVKKSLNHEVLTEYKTDFIQATTILVKDNLGPITVTAIYCPPKHSIKRHQYEHFFNSLGPRFIVGGDFNAKHPLWGSRTTNPKGRQLFQCLQCNNLKHISTGQPTYWPSDINKYPDVIDFFVTKSFSTQSISAQSSLELSSDHSPIVITINSPLRVIESAAKLHTQKTNWVQFKSFVEHYLPLQIPLKTCDDIEEAVEILNTVLQNAGWSSTPDFKPKNLTHRTDENIQSKIQEKRRLRKQWQETRHPVTKSRLNKATKMLRQALQEQERESMRRFLTKLSPSNTSNYSLWKYSKSVLKPTERIPPIKTNNGNWAKTNTEKVQLFADHFSNVFNPFPSQNTDHDNEVHSFVESAGQLELPIKKFSISELKCIIKKLNVKKAPGYDLITGKILKELPTHALKYIIYLFNAILRLSYFPKQWKVAEIQIVPKPGKPLEHLHSYRPISLLPILSKMFEKLFLTRLIPIINERNLIPDHQFGFRVQHSTIEQVHRVYNQLRGAIENKELCATAFLDITQAFDKVWHEGLLYKLKKILPYTFYEFFRTYLSERSFRIKLHDSTSDLYKINAGVPQGSVLGPVLYTLYTADLPLTNKTCIATYADDTVIMARDILPTRASQKLQNHLSLMESWLEKWRIRANATKSVQVTYTLKRESCPPVSLFRVQLPQAESAKYLGLHIDRRLTWQKHIFMKRKQLGIKLTSMFNLLGKDSPISIENKILLYKTVLKPIWTYGIQLWGTAAKTNISIIERFQSKTLRQIANAPRYVSSEILLRDLQVPSIQHEIQAFGNSYLKRLEQHPNILAAELATTTMSTRRLKRAIPADLF